MARLPYTLKGLKESMIAHRDLLGEPNKPRKIKFKDKNSNLKDVDEAIVLKAIEKLDEATAAVSEICQQGVLAIEVEP